MKSIVVVFVARGCGHCEEYLPRFRREAARFPRIALHVYDLSTGRGAEMGERFHVRATPTTCARGSDGRERRRVGTLDDEGIRKLLEASA